MASISQRRDGHLWMIALGISLLANAGIIVAVGFSSINAARLRQLSHAAAPPSTESVATIFADVADRTSQPDKVSLAPENRFSRTSDDQIAPSQEKKDFIGERNTQATSDRTPSPNAPPLPSQAGISPKDDSDIETTESRYKDGALGDNSSAPSEPETAPTPPAPVTPPSAEPTPPAEKASSASTDVPGNDGERSTPPPREKLLEGPNSVDVEVPRESAKTDEAKPAPEKRPAEISPPAPKPTEPNKTADAPKPKPTKEPGFKGYQRKTAVVGSISRTGRSALNVADTPLGRYQAAISRAVEQEWQRNCVRHRDYITPGFLTIRFFVETKGKVRSVQFVDDMESGEVQKGFTLNSIRDAEIPPMPPALRSEYDDEPLEIIFRFYF